MSSGRRVAVAQARASLPDLVQDVKRTGSRLRLTRYGKTIACLVPVKDVDTLEECESELADCQERRKVSRLQPVRSTPGAPRKPPRRR
jgi:prevent-host-death family protein